VYENARKLCLGKLSPAQLCAGKATLQEQAPAGAAAFPWAGWWWCELEGPGCGVAPPTPCIRFPSANRPDAVTAYYHKIKIKNKRR